MIPSVPISTEDDAPFALRRGKIVKRGNLWYDVRGLADQLPTHRHVLNLCEDRYLFCLVLLAAMQRGQICLLPPSRQNGVLREVLLDFPDSYLASENPPQELACTWFSVKPTPKSGTARVPNFDDSQTALIAFTSGSTGRPQPCAHRFGTFRISAHQALASLGHERERLLVVSTTPPQHMYGLETSVFWPLFSGLVLYSGRPFFPEDIRRVVESAPFRVILASTPTHLRSLVRTTGNWSNLAGILSSTANLSGQLARQTEAVMGAEVQEIYGSTETLSFACRKTVRETLWRPYRGVRLVQEKDGLTELISPHLQGPATLQDLFRVEKDGCFAVLGRGGDMVKIGGKRASLAEMNRRLTEIAGVDDGLLFLREDGLGECRMAALVVSRLDKQAIRDGLRPYLDEVFLPRSIHFVHEIPRNPVGKVVKEEWEKLLKQLDS